MRFQDRKKFVGGMSQFDRKSPLERPVMPVTGTEQRGEEVALVKLNNPDLLLLESIYELKTKRRMSRVLLRDVIRMAQRKPDLDANETTLKQQLKTLREGGYIHWVGHYLVTKAGEAFIERLSNRY